MLFRRSCYCPFCGEQLKEIHRNLEYDKTFVGDTFLGYETHKCKSVLDRFKKIE